MAGHIMNKHTGALKGAFTKLILRGGCALGNGKSFTLQGLGVVFFFKYGFTFSFFFSLLVECFRSKYLPLVEL
jgi:hypothetical protein